jgi:hypothetical protein
MKYEEWSEELEECRMYKERVKCEKEIAELEKRKNKMRKKIVFWQHKITGAVGQGRPLEAYLADAWVKRKNETYPDIIHVAADAEIIKTQGVEKDER